jgi:chaperonin GroES
MSVPIQPLADYIVAKQQEAQSKTASGFYLPENAKEKPKIAEVLAVGPGRVGDDNERIPVEVIVGDKVIYGGYSSTEIKIGNDTYLVIPEKDIYAVLKEAK